MYRDFLILLRVLFVALLAQPLGGCANDASGGTKGPVVLAASSMQEALSEAGEAWAARGYAAPVFSFAASSALARQIDSGAPADVFVSADEEWMDHIQGKGMLRAGSRAILARNRLVLVAAPGAGPATWDGSREGLMAALGRTGRLAMADPAGVPAGRYARASLQHLGLWDDVANRIAAAENVRAALALVQRGQAPLGIVYATDAAAAGLPALYQLPQESHPPIRYPVAVLAASGHGDAEGFRAFLLSADGQLILERHGFGAGS